MKINHWIVLALGSILTTYAVAKLPIPVLTDEQKAKAEEAKAKAADAAKKASADESRYQDRVADRYFREMKAAGKTVAPPTWVAPPPVVVAAAPASAAQPPGQSSTAASKPQDTPKPTKVSENAKKVPLKP
jgi:hypothetical protein